MAQKTVGSYRLLQRMAAEAKASGAQSWQRQSSMPLDSSESVSHRHVSLISPDLPT